MQDTGIAPNAKRLLWAGFMAILAAGVGFSIRGGILGDWGGQFGFTQSELGQITGGGLVGFGIIILLGALIADKVGYGKLMIFAFIMHFLSAVVTLAASPLFNSMSATDPAGAKNAAYWCLYIGMFMFAIGNGIAEAVVNPLVATLFPRSKTHYLNILHAGWPAGLIVGGLASFLMVGKVRWEIQMALFLVPTVLYGLMCLGQSFPKSEASRAGVTFGQMLAEFAAPVLLLLLFIHALVGYVELGTDSWISNITGNILADPKRGLLLFVYTSALMFALRFFAGPIVEKISPLGLLFVSAIFGAIGLTMLGSAQTGMLVVVAATIYGIGKTFLWPTMLGVVSERYPRGGAITIGAIGGIGMLSAGLLGGPGIGYKQDYFASNHLKQQAPQVYEQYKASGQNAFLFFPAITGLDGQKVAGVRAKAADARTPEEKAVHDADLHGGRTALKVTAAIPATMAVLYLVLIAYFRSKGGYRVVHVDGEKMTGGVEAPVR
ncbi:MAG TPA: MFS transporter [Methylomirabilota bacterium]|nr:MFS transporter [Methylomirabilota bacterium]